ncbi:GNAT family N-acetyltransferase [Tenacibaculum sp. MAR_2009_124]|uniref:GNAT family N-acetyltransferase n=1 Tax=Tenacibaculum sp. MAR_2009_124 TaxID=1250059 RepID=UPI00210136C0|nr:GNAT family N-acetyltransferase [Tenacibaculum sp. MAR_2009_124]
MNVDHWQYWKNPPKEKIEWVEEGISNCEFYFINTSQNENIGMVRILDEDLLYWGKQSQKAKYIHSLVIKETYNGKGLGAYIIKEIEAKARASKFEFLRLDADAKNVGLCNYYERIGFKKVGIKETSLSNNNLYQKSLQV